MFLDILFPKFCVGCWFMGSYLCTSCEEKLKYIQIDRCIYCNKASYRGLTHSGCKRILGIDGCMSIFQYDTLLKKIIKAIKYRLAWDVHYELIRVIRPEFLHKLTFFKEGDHPLSLQPIPLHSLRLNQRGFNYPDLLSTFFLRVIPRSQKVLLLKRVKNTQPQAQLKRRDQKYQNIHGAFGVMNPQFIKGKDFILIDDVVTTGNTIKEACKILKYNGARRVYVVTLARG